MKCKWCGGKTHKEKEADGLSIEVCNDEQCGGNELEMASCGDRDHCFHILKPNDLV